MNSQPGRRGLAAAIGLASLALASCKTTDATPDISPASSVVPKPETEFDRDAYCMSMCDRAATCGLEEATTLAGKVDRAALEKAKGNREGVQKDCVTSCGKSSLPAWMVPQARSAAACAKRDTCDAFATCLGELATR